MKIVYANISKHTNLSKITHINSYNRFSKCWRIAEFWDSFIISTKLREFNYPSNFNILNRKEKVILKMLVIYRVNFEDQFLLCEEFALGLPHLFFKNECSQQVELVLRRVYIFWLVARKLLWARDEAQPLTCLPGICAFHWNLPSLTTLLTTLLTRGRVFK